MCFGCIGLKLFLAKHGASFIVTDDKEGPESVFERELHDADVIISQPFWPACMTAPRFAKAKKLKLIITAGIGSNPVDLAEAVARRVDVVEVSGSNSISVAEHQDMLLLALVRNFVPCHEIASNGGWDIADCVAR